MRTVLGTLLASMMATTAMAAPFCAVFSFGKQCWYYSYDACLNAVGTSGACVINQSEVRAPSGGAPFCVVDAVGTRCWYYMLILVDRLLVTTAFVPSIQTATSCP
jgi:hypothetical protein